MPHRLTLSDCISPGFRAWRMMPSLHAISCPYELSKPGRCTHARGLYQRAASRCVAAVILAAIWLPIDAPAQGLDLAPAVPDLVVESLSVHATIHDASGERQVTASFRIVNRGTAPAAASLTSVQSAGGATILVTPALPRGSTAFFATTTMTSQTDFNITVVADVAKQ